jgi:uncharacterized protein YodC (DUF2158 family)
MSSFKQHDRVKAKGSETYMTVESVDIAADGAEVVTCRWEDMWRAVQRQTFRVDQLEAIQHPNRNSARRRRR